MSKELARMWKLTEGSRGVWEEAAAKEKGEYEERKSEWEAACEKITGKGKKKKEVRPPSKYMLFCASQRKEIMEGAGEGGEKLTFGDVAKELARRWAALGEDGKAAWGGAHELLQG